MAGKKQATEHPAGEAVEEQTQEKPPKKAPKKQIEKPTKGKQDSAQGEATKTGKAQKKPTKQTKGSNKGNKALQIAGEDTALQAEDREQGIQGANWQEVEEDETSFFAHLQHPKKKRFLEMYVACSGDISTAARLSRISRFTHYGWMKNDPEYVKIYEEAREIAADRLESTALEWAGRGLREPVRYGGKIVGYQRKRDPTMMIFMLKGLRPQKYRDNYNALAFQGNVTLQVGIPRPGDVIDAEAREITPEEGRKPVDNSAQGDIT